MSVFINPHVTVVSEKLTESKRNVTFSLAMQDDAYIQILVWHFKVETIFHLVAEICKDEAERQKY